MPQYIYTIDGVEAPWPESLPQGQPTPTPTPQTGGGLTLPEISDLGPTVKLGCPPYQPFKLIISPLLAADMEINGIVPFYAYIESMRPPGYIAANMDNQNAIIAMIQSQVPVVQQNNVWFDTQMFPHTQCQFYVPVSYQGKQPIPPSVPGIVIEETPRTGGGLPLPNLPPIIPEIEDRVKTHVEEPVTESRRCIDRVTGQIRGQIDYQMAQAALPLPKLESKISSNIINTMGEVYNSVYPVGLGIPSTEQIISGEPVYSPYGIGADIPYCDQPTPTTGGGYPLPQTPTPTPTTGGGYPLPQYPTPTPTPTPTTPPPVTPPGVTCPAPVVQCPQPPDINFAPNINIQIPQQGTPTVNVNIPVTPTPTPSPTPTEPTPTTGGGLPLPTEPSPTPSPTPTEPEPTEPTPTPPPPPPLSCPTPKEPKTADLDLPDSKLNITNDPWATGAPCAGAAVTLADPAEAIWNAFGWTKVKAGEWKPPDYINPDLYPAAFKWLGALAMNLVGLLIDSTAKTLSASLPLINNTSDFVPLAVGGFVQNWIGAPVLQFMQSNIYNINYSNPQRIPSEAEVVSLYLANEIDEGLMRCLVRANGSYDTWYSKIAHANRTRISNEQIIQLYRREIIPGDFADKLMRQNGVIDQNEANMIYRATEALPSTSDIVRFMVRDADDDTVAGKYGTDAAFDTKYGRQLKLWAKGQGITDEVMKYYWRSHWEIPSNTALFEMLHRLRPNRQSSGNQTGPTVTTNDIKDALVVNDMLPFWAERMIEISYRPLTRTDAQRAFFIDALSEQELKDAYLDIGYNDSNADKLVRFTKQLKAQRKQAKGGTEKATSVLKYYKNWLIGTTEAKQRLMNGGLSEQAANEALEIVNTQRKNDSQLACIKGVKSQYKKYAINDLDAQRELVKIGVAVENISSLIAGWNCERSFKPRELTASQVCKAYKEGIISKEQYLLRLKAIGYGEDESGILFELCATPTTSKRGRNGQALTPKTSEQTSQQTEAARNVTKAALDLLAQEGPK